MEKNQLMVLSLTVISMSCCPVNSAILFNHEIGIETVSKPKDQIIDPIHTTPSDDTGQSATFQSDCAVYGFDIDGQWAPKNEFATYSGSIGIGADSSGPSISASVNFTINQLTVTSLTNVATKHYETDYYISSDNNYNRYSAEYIGFFSFIRDSASVSPHFVMSHKISYHGVEWFGLETKTYNISV